MISSPDLLAFTAETDFRESPAPKDTSELPEDLSVPLYPQSEDSTPWSRTSRVKFNKDFILIAEFSEQVGPQPLLTIPDEKKACGSFDLNHFSLRIMSVDYQTSFAGSNASGCAKLNFVEDSKVVLGDSMEGTYAYVHHLTLYDLEARGFVRPFCMAYVSSDEEKIMQNFPRLSGEFSKASECLKTGNRKNFAQELEKKLGDLEYTRLVLLKEIKTDSQQKLFVSDDSEGKDTVHNGSVEDKVKDVVKGRGRLLLTTEEQELKERLGLSVEEEIKEHNGPSGFHKGEINSDGGAFVLSGGRERGRNTTNRSERAEELVHLKQTEKNRSAKGHVVRWPDKAAELVSVEKAIQEHRGLLKQITSYPTRKLQDSEFMPYEPDDALLEPDMEPYIMHSQIPEPGLECNVFTHTSLHAPQLVSSTSSRQFDKRLKNLEELCDDYFRQLAMKQLRSTEKYFRGDNSYLFTWQLTQTLLHDLKSTSFLFEDLCDLEARVEQQMARPEARSALLPLVSPLQSEPMSLESYSSCVEMVPIKLEVSENRPPPLMGSSVPAFPCEEIPMTSDSPDGIVEDVEEVSVAMKDSISSGDSIEVLGTEKSFRTQGLHMGTDTIQQKPLLLHTLSLERRKFRKATRRMNSEDSIEVLSITDSIVPEDLRASYPSAIHEETLEHYEEEKVTHPSQEYKDTCSGGKQASRQDSQSNPGTPTIVLTPPDICIDSALSHVNYLESCVFAGPLCLVADAGSVHEGHVQLAQDDFSDCNSYLSLTSTVSEASFWSRIDRVKNFGLSQRRCGKLGRLALRFLRTFPFAVHAVYSLLSGRTLVVLGNEEAMVRRWVKALSIYTPHVDRGKESMQPWISEPLQITDLLHWKLVGYNRMASAASPNMPRCLGRYSRYISVLDLDQRTLRCPAYRGSLLCTLVEPRMEITNGTTYFLYARSVIGQLVSKAFLLAFSQAVHRPASQSERATAEGVLRDFHDDDLRILCFLSEQIRIHFMEPPCPILRFSYSASTFFKW